MQSREYSKDGGTDGSGYERCFVVNVNWNADNGEWNVNTWNRNGNKWAEGKRVFSPETIEILPRLKAWKFLSEFLFSIHLLLFRPSEDLQTRKHTSYYQAPEPPTRSVERI